VIAHILQQIKLIAQFHPISLSLVENSALIKEKLYAGEAIVATAFGIIFGPHCANLIDPRQWGNPSFDDITLEFTRIVLALSVFAVGVELPR